ncbi:MAG TPA: class I SAM-dependent methyltransferase [Pseudolysinimonas sp.]
MTDQEISAEITRVWAEIANTQDCVIFLSPREKMPEKDYQPLADARVRFLITGNPALDLEIHETDDARHVFIRKIGPQEALDALPVAPFDGTRYRLPDRIFAPGDGFREDYSTAKYGANYSLYTELCSGLKPTSIFEIGVRYGYSAWAMLSGCPAGTTYHGVDINSLEYANGMLHEEFPQHDLRLARADSGTMTHLSRTYDLAHVDGNHSHEGALHDIGLCWGRAKYILIDDVTAFCTVNSAMNEWLAKYPPGYKAVRYDTQTGHVLLGPLPYMHNGG